MMLEELLQEVTNAPVVKKAITNHNVLNEAYSYGSAFSRGLHIELNGLSVLLISGRASLDGQGNTVHVAARRAQARRTYSNRGGLRASQGASWNQVVRTTSCLRAVE